MVIQQHAACEHVAAVYGSASRWDQFVIFLELCSGGELCSLVATRGALPEAEVHGYFKQIIAGVVHMHSVGIVHRDLKLENVMLTDKGHVRIIDFGLAHQYSMGDDGTYKERPLSRCCGSEVYSAPEVLDPDVGYSYKADLWSCGVILFALLYGCFPLELASLSDWRFRKLIAAEKAGRGASFAVLRWIERPQHLSHKVCVLIDGLLRVQQAQRLSAVEASANEWVDMPSLSANLSYDSLCEISDEETRRNTARNAARDGPTAGGAPNTAHRGHVAGHVAGRGDIAAADARSAKAVVTDALEWSPHANKADEADDNGSGDAGDSNKYRYTGSQNHSDKLAVSLPRSAEVRWKLVRRLCIVALRFGNEAQRERMRERSESYVSPAHAPLRKPRSAKQRWKLLKQLFIALIRLGMVASAPVG